MTVLGLLTTTYGAPSAREDLESLLLGVAAGDSHSLEELYHRTGPQSTVWCSPT